MTLSLSKAELRAAFAKLRVHLAEGKEPDDIAIELGLSLSDYEDLVKRFYASESEVIRDRTTEEVYVDYTIKQMQNIRDLDKLLEMFQDTKQHAALVGAIRARSDIYDKIIDRGQEFGFIEKQPERKIIAGMVVSNLSTPELRKAIVGELSQLERIANDFGDAQDILDVKVGPTHAPPSKMKALPAALPRVQAPTNVKAHARNAVHGGRKTSKKK